MNKKELLKTIYRKTNDLQVKHKILKFLLNKVCVIGLSDIDFKLETLLNEYKIFPNRYGRGYYSAIYEL